MTNLQMILGWMSKQEASDSEKRIVEMLGNGELISLYDDYINFSGEERDPFFRNLLLLLEKKELRELLEFFNVIQDPILYLWPKDAFPDGVSFKDEKRILDALFSMQAAPLRCDDFEALERIRVLPDELLSMLGKVSSYAEGSELLAQWRVKEVLLPRDYHADEYQHLNLDEYARVARVRCLGHTSAALERIDLIIGDFQNLKSTDSIYYSSIYSATLTCVIERLQKLKDAKITPADNFFMLKVTDLLIRRKRNASGALAANDIGGVGLAILFLLLFILMSMENKGAFFVLILMIIVLFYLSMFDSNVRKIDKQIDDACMTYLAHPGPPS
jgi:hypothetical protein